MTTGPGRQVRALHEDLGAPREKRPQRDHQNLIERSGRPFRRAGEGIPSIDPRRRLVPALDQRLEPTITPERDDLIVVGQFERLEPPQDIGRLAQRQPEVGPVERDVPEADDRPAGGVLGTNPIRLRVYPRQRHARLHAALHLDQRDLHVDGRRQLRLIELELFELDHLARFRSRGAWGAVDGHGEMVQEAAGWRLEVRTEGQG